MKEYRATAIAEYLSAKKMVSLDELCNDFQVSKTTIRRDVNELTRLGYVNKVYGGIVLNEKRLKPVNESDVIPYLRRLDESTEAKKIIGKLAAGLIEDGDTIFIDSGTTTKYILEHIAERRDIHVITNSLPVLNGIKMLGIETHCLGGIYMPKTDSFVGGSAALKNVRITKAFMGASYVDTKGMTNFSYHEAEMKRAVIESSDRIIIMADTTKFGHAATICFCQIENVSAVVIEKRPPEEFVSKAEDLGIELIYADME
jgi:DeoR family myo-inositol catabolism operon transcriptional repressor